MRALTPGAPAPPVNTRQGGVHTGTAAPTGASELAFSHSRLPATLPTHAYPTFFNSHHPPRLPPTKIWDAHGTTPRVSARARRRFTWIVQRSSSACSLVRTTSAITRIRPRQTPPSAANTTHTGCNGRLDDRTLSQSSLGPNVLCGRDARMQCCLESFCASRLSALRARLCMCAVSDVRHASRRALGCPCRVLPCRSHARWEGGCAQTALRVCSLLL